MSEEHYCERESGELVCEGEKDMELRIWDGNFGAYRYYEINYCPFCGRKKND